MKSDKITWIFFLIVLIGIIGGVFHLLRLYIPQSKTGKITIISTPPGAIVYLNGEEKGKTPLLLKKIPQREHNLKLVKEGFKIWAGKVKVEKKIKIIEKLEPLPPKIKYIVQKPITIPSPLPQVKFGELNISSSPPCAMVYLNGILQKGITPLHLDKVKTGLYKIKVVKNNYQSFESKIIIQPGMTTYIKAKLELLLGSLFINSNPQGATVYLNDEEKGKTPLVISHLIPWQPYQLQVRLFKHYDWASNIFVDPASEEKIEVNLKPKLEGFLYVTSTPPVSLVYLDNDLIGKTPLRKFTLKPGNYILKVMQEGYLAQTKEITIPDEESIFVNFELKRVNE